MGIKNIEILADIINVEDIEWLESAAEFYINHSHIIFEIISIEDNLVNIKAQQHWNVLERYASPSTITGWSQGLFERVLPGYTFSIQSVAFTDLDIEIVTVQWISNQMLIKKINVQDMAFATGLPASKFNAWISNEAQMSRTVKSMFYYLLNK